jgi:hypothetical protein
VSWLAAELAIWSRIPDEPPVFAIVGMTRAIAPVTVFWQLAACPIALDKVELAVF